VKMHCVFIGIDLYKDKKINSLRYAKADAEKFYHQVIGSPVACEAHIQLLTNQQATKQKILKVVGETLPRNVARDDPVLLYFSGHGSPETSNSPDRVARYLVTYDTEYESIFATAIDLERDLTRLIERIPSNLIVVLLDTCFSGRAGGRTFEGPNVRASRASWRESFKLADLKLGEGRLLLAACDDDEVAYEDPTLKQGVFTYYLLQALTASHTSESWISLNALYEKTSQNVHAFTMGRQTPIMNGRMKMACLPLFRES